MYPSAGSSPIADQNHPTRDPTQPNQTRPDQTSQTSQTRQEPHKSNPLHSILSFIYFWLLTGLFLFLLFPLEYLNISSVLDPTACRRLRSCATSSHPIDILDETSEVDLAFYFFPNSHNLPVHRHTPVTHTLSLSHSLSLSSHVHTARCRLLPSSRQSLLIQSLISPALLHCRGTGVDEDT